VKVLVVHAHPNPDSYNAALFRQAVESLTAAGHEVFPVDLYAIGFRPEMSADERARYESDEPVVDPQVAEQIELIRAVDAMVFVYPSWWSSLPAVLKGWLERTMVPGVGFVLDTKTRKVRPALTQVRHIVGIATYGSPITYVKAVNDNGRRVLFRALRLSTGRSTKCTWLSLYSIDTSTAEKRTAFLTKVDTTMRGLR
jgi:NAD(P)H dehydrogenase (quinone)